MKTIIRENANFTTARQLAARMDAILVDHDVFGRRALTESQAHQDELADAIMGYALIPVLVDQFNDMAAEKPAMRPAWKTLKADLLAFAKNAKF